MSSSSDLVAAHGTARTRVPRQFAPMRVGQGPLLVDEHEAARSTGYAEGWAQGRRDAMAAAEADRARDEEQRRRLGLQLVQQTTSACDALAAATRQVEGRTVAALEDLGDEVLAAAVRLAEAVLGAELSALDGAGLLALRRALAPLPDDGRVVVRMSPQDVDVVRAVLRDGHPDGSTCWVEGHEVEIVTDPGLRRGEAVADQGAARVDARLDSALRRAVVAAGLLPAGGDLADRSFDGGAR